MLNSRGGLILPMSGLLPRQLRPADAVASRVKLLLQCRAGVGFVRNRFERLRRKDRPTLGDRDNANHLLGSLRDGFLDFLHVARSFLRHLTAFLRLRYCAGRSLLGLFERTIRFRFRAFRLFYCVFAVLELWRAKSPRQPLDNVFTHGARFTLLKRRPESRGMIRVARLLKSSFGFADLLVRAIERNFVFLDRRGGVRRGELRFGRSVRSNRCLSPRSGQLAMELTASNRFCNNLLKRTVPVGVIADSPSGRPRISKFTLGGGAHRFGFSELRRSCLVVLRSSGDRRVRRLNFVRDLALPLDYPAEFIESLNSLANSRNRREFTLRTFMRGRLSRNVGLSGLCLGVCLAKLSLSARDSSVRIVQGVEARDNESRTARSIEPVATYADLLVLRIELLEPGAV